MKKIDLFRPIRHHFHFGKFVVLLALAPGLTRGSSHMDAPLITLDPAANTTDVYAFVSQRDGTNYLTTALSVYPFEEPGIGPNKYNFDDNVRYEIHVATTNQTPGLRGATDVSLGRATFSYQFEFKTGYKNTGTILQSYLGVITNVADNAQNLVQTYTVKKFDHRRVKTTLLGSGVVPPNNQGIATPFYNVTDNGTNTARPGVEMAANLDRYTAQTIYSLTNGYRVFAGQREDGFYGDIQAIFDLLQLRSPGKDAQQGFNVHTIVLEIPLGELGGAMQVAGVYATTSRQSVTVLRDGKSFLLPQLNNGKSFGVGDPNRASLESGRFVQVGRQGNPLFCEGLVAIADKDLYNRSIPRYDAVLFQKYALNPELAGLLNALVFGGNGPAIGSNRTDLAGIFIPDLIKVDLSTGPARLTGGNADDAGFSRLSVFGGDALTSQVQAGLPGFPAGTIPGGWPNGRRFGDDVVDIAVTAVISDLRNNPLVINGPAGDNVNANDAIYNKVFPYAATPHNGRTHTHH